MVISNEEIKLFWSNELIRYTKDDLRKFKFSEDTIQFLCAVGLPDKKLSSKIIFKEFFDADHFKEIIINNDIFIIIGKHTDVDTSLIVKLDTMELYTTRDLSKVVFINSNLKNYLVFEQLYRTESSKIKEPFDEEENLLFVKNLKTIFSDIDSKALEDGTYWDGVLFPYEIGLF